MDRGDMFEAICAPLLMQAPKVLRGKNQARINRWCERWSQCQANYPGLTGLITDQEEVLVEQLYVARTD